MPSIQVSGVGATIAICGSGVSAGADTGVGAVVIGSICEATHAAGEGTTAAYAGCVVHIVIQVGISVIAIQSFCVIANGAGASVGVAAGRGIGPIMSVITDEIDSTIIYSITV